MREEERHEVVIAKIKGLNTGYYGEGIALHLGKRNSLIDRFTTGENARLFWASVCRNIKPERLRSRMVRESPEVAYFLTIERMMVGLDGLDFKTPAAHARELNDIAARARELINSLVGKTENALPWEIHPSYGYKMLGGDRYTLLHIIAGTTKGEDDAIEAECLYHQAWEAKSDEERTANDNILQGRSYDEMTPEQEAAFEAYKPARDKDWLIHKLGNSTLVSVLTELEKRALEAADWDLIVKRSKDRRAAEVKWLAANLYPLHVMYFESPLWDTLALAITLALDADPALSADDIRPLIKARKGGSKGD